MNFGCSAWFKNLKLPLILQDENAECGHACIAMLSHYWGHKLDLYTLRALTKPSNRGITLVEIKDILSGLGFKSRALSVPLNELKWVKCPAILHWNMNHFVVLKQVKKNGIVIHDPARGVRYCNIQEVSNSFTGIVLEVEKAIDFKKITQNQKIRLYDLVKTIKGINLFIGLLLLLSLCIEIFNLLNPLFMQYVTDYVISFSSLTNLYTIAIGFCLLIFIQSLSEYLRSHMIIYLTNNLTEQFSSNLVRHILQLPLDFFEKRHKGDIQAKFQSIELIQKKISTDFINTVLDGLMIIINFMVMLLYSRVLSAIVLFTLCAYLILRHASYQILKKQMESSVYQHAKAASMFLETLQSIIPIKCFLKERVRLAAWQNSYVSSLNADIKVAKMQAVYQVVNQLLFHVEHIIIICIGAALVLNNQFSIGMLIAFLSYRLLLVTKASNFIQNIFDFKLIAIQLNRLGDILYQQPEIINEGTGSFAKFSGALTLRQVSFQYNTNEQLVLNKINLHINSGEKIAIIGPSGSGKSTLLKVMMGLIAATEGEIFIDNIPLKEFGLKNYRQLTASVLQEDTLISGSISENIAFFADNIDKEQVYHVAKLAFIHDTIIKLPMGYETLVGDMGSTLSGGQKQRILLARALYKNPRILFLDEATSHLDADNEKNINYSLQALAITQVIIAHRQETIQMAERIINLEGINQKTKV